MLRLPHLLLPIPLLAALALTGCAGPSFPDVQPTPTQISIGAIQGNDWGGHAPLVGAHIFLLQAGTGGYGAKATSLLSSSYTGSYPTAQDGVTGSPTNGFYYVTSSSQGYFNLNGDYTCTAGDPVYLYASGGNPNTTPAVNITGASAAPDANGNLLVTFTTTGQPAALSGRVGHPRTPFIRRTRPFKARRGRHFDGLLAQPHHHHLRARGRCLQQHGAPAAFTATATQATAANNPAIVNLGLLGVCPAPFNITGVPVGTSSNVPAGHLGLGHRQAVRGRTDSRPRHQQHVHRIHRNQQRHNVRCWTPAVTASRPSATPSRRWC